MYTCNCFKVLEKKMSDYNEVKQLTVKEVCSFAKVLHADAC